MDEGNVEATKEVGRKAGENELPVRLYYHRTRKVEVAADIGDNESGSVVGTAASVASLLRRLTTKGWEKSPSLVTVPIAAEAPSASPIGCERR